MIWLFSVTGLVSIAQYAIGLAWAVGTSGDANFFAALQVAALPFGALLAIEMRNTRTRRSSCSASRSPWARSSPGCRGGILALVAVFLLLSLQPARGFFKTRACKRIFLLFVTIGAGILLAASYSALSARTSSLFSQGGDQDRAAATPWRAVRSPGGTDTRCAGSDWGPSSAEQPTLGGNPGRELQRL